MRKTFLFSALLLRNTIYFKLKKTNSQIKFSEPTAKILGGPDLYVDKGSTINLTCVIGMDPEAPRYILWYHEDKVIENICMQ